MKTNRFWLFAPWGLAFALALGWVVYWHMLAGEAERSVNAFIAEQNAAGAEARIGAITPRGFPLFLRLELSDVSYAPARGGWRAETDRAELHVQPFRTDHLMLRAPAPIAISRADGAVTHVSARTLIASVRRRGEALAQAGIEADDLTLDDPAKEGALSAHKIVINLRPDPRTAGAYQLAFEAQGLRLPRPVRSFEAFGLDVASLRAALVLTNGEALIEGAREDPLGPWREAGGRVRFEALALHWGPLEATGRGEGGLDSQRRLEGALSFPIEHPAPVLSALANGPDVSSDARRALTMLAAGYAFSGDDITLDVDARDGVLRLDGLPVRALPPVY